MLWWARSSSRAFAPDTFVLRQFDPVWRRDLCCSSRRGGSGLAHSLILTRGTNSRSEQRNLQLQEARKVADLRSYSRSALVVGSQAKERAAPPLLKQD